MKHRKHRAVKTKEGSTLRPQAKAPIHRFCIEYARLLVGAALGLSLLMSPAMLARAQASTSPILTVPSVPQATAAGSQNHPVSTVDRDWWNRVQRGLARYEYHPSKNDNGLQAPNRAHHLRTYFDASGIRVYDRTSTGNVELVSLSLTGLGRGGLLEAVADGVVHQVGGRVEIRRDSITEWYENSPQGLEQGFTLLTRVPGEGLLVLELAVKRARASRRGAAIELLTDTGRRLRYGKLIAQDAAGQILSSRLEVPSPQHIRLVINDASAHYPVLIDPLLTGVADSVLESNQTDDGSFDSADFGGSVAAAGDVNGDGFADIVVGARGWDNGLFDEGAAFVFLGGINGMDTTPNAVIQSSQAASEFGVSVAGAGDVNGDGFADIIVGSNLYDGILPGTNLRVNGAAFVFHGGPSGIIATDPTMADAKIEGNQIDSMLGFSVAGAGDVNGDGFADIIVGVPRQGSPTFPPNIPPNEGQGTGGAALIFHGSAAGITGTGFDTADTVLLPYPPGFPEPSGTLMGAAVSGAGDVNGDGFDDVILNGNGVLVFLGGASGIVGTDPSTAHAQILGSNGIVSSAGDVNGDGFGDIILGGPAYPNITPGIAGSFRGAFGVFLGGPNGITATDFIQAQTFVEGTIANQELGRKVAGAGDIDNDGFDDIIVGALGYAGSLDSEGAAYVFRGSSSGIVATTLLDAYVRLESNQSSAVRRLNRSEIDVAGVGDVNGDGFADVVLGLGFYDVDQLNEGAVFVYHGGPAPINPNQPPIANAGADQVVLDDDGDGFATITVDGNASFDPDGSIVSYAWFEGETLLGSSAIVTTTLPVTGDHTLVLTVTDNEGLTRGDPVIVHVGLVESTRVFFDNFDSLASWQAAGDVTLSGADTFPTPPQVRMGATGSTLSRMVTMPAGSTGLTLDFQGKATGFSPSDQVLIKVSVNGGPFETIFTITSANSSGTYTFYGGSAIPLGFSWLPATASTIQLRFESNLSTGQFFLDDLRLDALQAPTGGPQNQAPIANAGADQTVTDNDGDGAETVTLDGSASADPDGTIAAYEWREGTTQLGTSATVNASFDVGLHTVTLTVTDDTGASSSAAVTVTVDGATPPEDAPPTTSTFSGRIGRNATITHNVLIEAAGQVDVRLSRNDRRASLNLTARAPNGSVLASGSGSNPIDIAFATTGPGTYSFVINNTSRRRTDYTLSVTYPVGPASNQAPIANAGANQSAADGDGNGSESFTLDGSGSADLDGSIVSYEWREGTTLLGSGITQPVTFGTGSHTVTLTVTDNEGGSASDTTTITVTPNQVPVVSAGANQVVNDSDLNGSESVTVDGSGSFDPDGTITGFTWREGTSVLGTGATLTTTLGIGTHTLTLTATDNGGASASATTLITVTANQAPIANAGPDQTIVDTDGDGLVVVTFDGSASTDPDGTIMSYFWTKNGNTFNNAATFSLTQPTGVHTVQLTVTDNQGATGTDTVIVTIVAPDPPADNLPPVANAGPDQTVDAGANGIASVVLDGTASSDPDGGISGYEWWEGNVQIGSSFVVGVPFNVGVHTVTLVVYDNFMVTSTDNVVVTVNAAGPSSPPQGVVSISGPSSVDRGDQVSFTVILSNTGTTTLSAAQLSFSVSPSDRLKDVSPGSTVSVGSVPPGGSVSQTWNGRADREGSATVTAEAFSGGNSLDTATQALTVVK